MLRTALSSRLSKAISGQTLVSIFHFSLNVALLPTVTTHDYGVFALSFVLAMFAAAINNALISTPLSIYTPVVKDIGERHRQEALFNALNTLFSTSLVFIGLIVALGGQPHTIAVALFVASYSSRQYSRSFGYARLRAEIPAKADLIYVACSATTAGLSALIYGPSIDAILLCLALGNTAATLFEFFSLKDAWRIPKSMHCFRAYIHLWPQTRWALIGAVTTLFMGQAHSIIVTSSHGPAAFAPLAAGGVLFGPIRVALTTWQNMSKPQMAIDLDAKRFAQVKSSIQQTTLTMIVALCLIAVGLWLTWPYVDALLYQKKYHNEPMAMIVALWTIITLFVTLNAPAGAALQALADFKILAMASIYGSIISTAVVLSLLYSQGPSATLVGTLIAEAFMSAYLFSKLFKQLDQQP